MLLCHVAVQRRHLPSYRQFLNAAIAATGKSEIRISKSESRNPKQLSGPVGTRGLAVQSFPYGLLVAAAARVGAVTSQHFTKRAFCHPMAVTTHAVGAKRHEPLCRTIHVFHCIRAGLP